MRKGDTLYLKLTDCTVQLRIVSITKTNRKRYKKIKRKSLTDRIADRIMNEPVVMS